jgi:hypothetical protein
MGSPLLFASDSSRDEPLRKESVGDMRLTDRCDSGVTPKVAKKARVVPVGDLASGVDTISIEQQGQHGDRGRELPHVGLDEEAVIVEQ